MERYYLLLAAIAFLVNFASFMYALILRFNVKQKMAAQGADPAEAVFEYAAMLRVDPKAAHRYRLAIWAWFLSLLTLAALVAAVFLGR